MRTVGGRIGERLGTRRVLVPVVAMAAIGTVWATASPSTFGFRTAAQAVAPGNGQSNDTCIEPSKGAGNCLGAFGVSVAPLTPLYPGQTRQLQVTWSNPNSFDILVDSYTATVAVPLGTSAGCPAASLVLPRGTQWLATKVAVAPKRTALTSVPVTLASTATDACRRVAFSVTVSATAVKR